MQRVLWGGFQGVFQKPLRLFGDFAHLASSCSNIPETRNKATVCPKASFTQALWRWMSLRPRCIIRHFQGGQVKINQEAICSPSLPHMRITPAHWLSCSQVCLGSPIGNQGTLQGRVITTGSPGKSLFLPFSFSLGLNFVYLFIAYVMLTHCHTSNIQRKWKAHGENASSALSWSTPPTANPGFSCHSQLLLLCFCPELFNAETQPLSPRPHVSLTPWYLDSHSGQTSLLLNLTIPQIFCLILLHSCILVHGMTEPLFLSSTPYIFF